MSLPARLLGANPSIQVSTLLSGSLSTPSAKGAKVPEFGDFSDAYETIATFTATSTTNQIQFSSIPQTYRHLHFRIVARGVPGANSSMVFYVNTSSSGTTNRSSARSNFTSSTQQIKSSTPQYMGMDMTATSPALTIWEGWCSGYTDSNTYKQFTWRMGSQNSDSNEFSYSSNFYGVTQDPITQLTFYHNSGPNNLAAGTMITMFGLK